MKFLIQTINGEIKHDFSFALIQAIEYQNWYRNSQDLLYVKSEDILLEGYVPIGTTEFVCNYLQKYYNKTPKPRNVPEELFKYACRNITNGTHKDILNKEGKFFVKSNDKIKTFTDIIDNKYPIPEGNYQISDIIEIPTEWRCFVYKKELVGLQNYAGNFTLFPDVSKIYEIIQKYTSAPIAYTLDITINVDLYNKRIHSPIIEVHDFFSCGLYGFNDSRILPQMFNDWFKEYINE